MNEPTELLLWGIIAHLVADWPLQTEWMALNKSDLYHPAAWVHSGIHTCFMLLIFAWPQALLIGISHLLIDTRKPISWWMRIVKRMSREDPHAYTVETWVDQVFHISMIALVVLFFYRHSL